MSTICPTALFRRLVDLDVFDDEVSGVETLGVGVCFCVFEETEEEFGGFDGPAGFGDAELFAYWGKGGVLVMEALHWDGCCLLPAFRFRCEFA